MNVRMTYMIVMSMRHVMTKCTEVTCHRRVCHTIVPVILAMMAMGEIVMVRLIFSGVEFSIYTTCNACH